MLKLREKIGQYQEQFYLAFILAIGCLMSMGLESGDRPYQIVFAVVSVLWGLKMLSTDFTKKEIFWMVIIAFPIGLNFLGNHEKTLIMTAMAIFGAKNVSLEKVFKYGFWSKFVVTVGTISLAALGIINNTSKLLAKNGEYYEIYGYGFGHPNVTFGNIFLVLTLAILAYGDRLRWYIYLVFTLIVLGAYQLFMCRTGIVVWACLLVMLLGYRLARKWTFDRIFLSLFCTLPILLVVITCVFIVLSMYNSEFSAWINNLFTGRIRLMIQGLENMEHIYLGQVPRHLYDNLNFYLLYNYGIIILLFSLVSYTYAIWYCYKQGKDYEVIILGIVAIYSFMEYFPLSTAWNLSLLCLSRILFKTKDT